MNSMLFNSAETEPDNCCFTTETAAYARHGRVRPDGPASPPYALAISIPRS